MPLYQQLLLFIGLGVNIQSISSNVTLDGTSEHFQVLTPTGANRNVTLNAPGTTAGVPSIQGLWYLIRCDTAASYSVLVKSGVTTLVTLAPGDWAYVACGGSLGSLSWKVMASSAGLSTLTLTGALSAASAAISGALSVGGAFTSTSTMTTTGGVSGGTARKIGGPVHVKQGSTTVTNTTTETDFATHTLEASTIGLGTLVEIEGTVRVTGNTATPTLNIQLYLGSTVLVSTGAVAQISGDRYSVRFRIVGQAAPGASTTISSNGVVTAKLNGATTASSVVSGTVSSVPTNGTLVCRMTGTWSASSALNIAVCDDFVVKVTG